MRGDALPRDFVRFSVGDARVVARTNVAPGVRDALRAGTLYEYGARHPAARRLSGRGVAYAVALPGDPDPAVIRHNRHGGALAALTRDLFLPPTRAERELRISERLRLAGVPTPPMLAVAVYSAAFLLRRSDTVTREIADSHDLSTAIVSVDRALRERALRATARLLATLSAAGARHHDLNVKNVLLRLEGNGDLTALVLDVDRVTFTPSARAPVFEQNLSRLLRSARKWRDQYGARVTEAELSALMDTDWTEGKRIRRIGVTEPPS